MMNLRHIEVFHAVYQTGSVSAAARTLHVSQPTISKVLRHAETRVGFTLFRVVKGRLVATEEAHILFHEARELHARVESLQETTKNLRRGGEGHLRLSVLPSLGLDIAPAAIARFRADHPHISFEVKTLHNEDILRSLYERNSDLALAYDAPRHPRLAHVRLGSGELVVLFRKEAFPDAPDCVSLDMFGGENVIRLSAAGSVGTLLATEFDEEDTAKATISVQTYYVAAALVRHGGGIAVVDEFTARASLGSQLDFRPFKESRQFNLFCVHLEERPLSRIAQDFIKTMQRTIEYARS